MIFNRAFIMLMGDRKCWHLMLNVKNLWCALIFFLIFMIAFCTLLVHFGDFFPFFSEADLIEMVWRHPFCLYFPNVSYFIWHWMCFFFHWFTLFFQINVKYCVLSQTYMEIECLDSILYFPPQILMHALQPISLISIEFSVIFLLTG